MSGNVLPVVVIDHPQGLILACLCGAEGALIRKGLANDTMTGLRGSGEAMPRLRADVTPAGLLRIILHAQRCVRGQNRGLQLNAALRSEAQRLLDSPPGRQSA